MSCSTLRGCVQVSSRLELWGDELQRTEPPRDPQQAEQALAAHNESVARMQHATYQVHTLRLLQYISSETISLCSLIIAVRIKSSSNFDMFQRLQYHE